MKNCRKIFTFNFLGDLFLIIPSQLIEVLNVPDSFGSLPLEEAVKVVPRSHFPIKFGRLSKEYYQILK